MSIDFIKPSRIKYQTGKHRRCKIESKRKAKQVRLSGESPDTEDLREWLRGDIRGSMEASRDS